MKSPHAVLSPPQLVLFAPFSVCVPPRLLDFLAISGSAQLAQEKNVSMSILHLIIAVVLYVAFGTSAHPGYGQVIGHRVTNAERFKWGLPPLPPRRRASPPTSRELTARTC